MIPRDFSPHLNGVANALSPDEPPAKAAPIDMDSASHWKAKYEELCLNLHTWSVPEIAVRNFNVMDYMRHWEGRAERAEAQLAAGDEIVARLREIVNGGIEGKPGYSTDQEIYRQMHGQVFRLLEWDAPRRTSGSPALSSTNEVGK